MLPNNTKTKALCEEVSEFVFNIPPTAKVIWRQGHGKVASDRQEEQGIKLGTPRYKASGMLT